MSTYCSPCFRHKIRFKLRYTDSDDVKHDYILTKGETIDRYSLGIEECADICLHFCYETVKCRKCGKIYSKRDIEESLCKCDCCCDFCDGFETVTTNMSEFYLGKYEYAQIVRYFSTQRLDSALPYTANF